MCTSLHSEMLPEEPPGPVKPPGRLGYCRPGTTTPGCTTSSAGSTTSGRLPATKARQRPENCCNDMQLVLKFILHRRGQASIASWGHASRRCCRSASRRRLPRYTHGPANHLLLLSYAQSRGLLCAVRRVPILEGLLRRARILEGLLAPRHVRILEGLYSVLQHREFLP